MIYNVIPKKYHNYTSTKILKHANILTKLNKLTYVHLLNMAPHDAYSNKYTYLQWTYQTLVTNKRSKTPLSTKQDSRHLTQRLNYYKPYVQFM